MPNVVKNDFSAVKDFFELVLQAHVVAAVMEYGMSSVDQLPTRHVFPLNYLTASTSTAKEYLSDTVEKFVDEFVQHYFDSILSLRRDVLSPAPEEETAAGVQDNVPTTDTDGVFDYACAVVGHGLLALNMHDASRHGDGMGLYRCWKLLLLHFKADQRTKYALEAFHFITQVEALLTPRLAHELIWNLTCNPHGGLGRNIPLDLQEEFFNRLFKDDINTYRANITDSSVSRSANAIGPMQELLRHLDPLIGFHGASGRHNLPEVKGDFDLVLKTLNTENVFRKVPGRQHSAYRSIHANPFSSLSKAPEKLRKWLIAKRKLFAIEQAIDKGRY